MFNHKGSCSIHITTHTRERESPMHRRTRISLSETVSVSHVADPDAGTLSPHDSDQRVFCLVSSLGLAHHHVCICSCVGHCVHPHRSSKTLTDTRTRTRARSLQHACPCGGASALRSPCGAPLWRAARARPLGHSHQPQCLVHIGKPTGSTSQTHTQPLHYVLPGRTGCASNESTGAETGAPSPSAVLHEHRY